jgi:signal transduction histidine kinase
MKLTDKIIRLHRGTISIESQLQKGTKVKVSIPFLS